MEKPLPPSIEAIHRAACAAGEAGYLDPRTWLFVQTAVQLGSLPTCCGSGCRQCPWPAEAQRSAGRATIRKTDTE